MPFSKRIKHYVIKNNEQAWARLGPRVGPTKKKSLFACNWPSKFFRHLKHTSGNDRQRFWITKLSFATFKQLCHIFAFIREDVFFKVVKTPFWTSPSNRRVLWYESMNISKWFLKMSLKRRDINCRKWPTGFVDTTALTKSMFWQHMMPFLKISNNLCRPSNLKYRYLEVHIKTWKSQFDHKTDRMQMMRSQKWLH